MACWCRFKRWILPQRLLDPRVECRRQDKKLSPYDFPANKELNQVLFIPFVSELKHSSMSVLQLFYSCLKSLGWWVQLVCESCHCCFTSHLLRQSAPQRAGAEVAFRHTMTTEQESWAVWQPCTKGSKQVHQAQYLWGLLEILSRWSLLKEYHYLGKSHLNWGSFGSGNARHCVALSQSPQMLLL